MPSSRLFRKRKRIEGRKNKNHLLWPKIQRFVKPQRSIWLRCGGGSPLERLAAEAPRQRSGNGWRGRKPPSMSVVSCVGSVNGYVCKVLRTSVRVIFTRVGKFLNDLQKGSSKSNSTFHQPSGRHRGCLLDTIYLE